MRNPSALLNNTLLNFLGQGKTLSMTPFFLAITTGPLIFGLFELVFPSVFQKQKVEGKIDVVLEENIKTVKTGTKKVVKKTAIAISCFSSLRLVSP